MHGHAAGDVRVGLARREEVGAEDQHEEGSRSGAGELAPPVQAMTTPMRDQAEQPGHHEHDARDALEADHQQAERRPRSRRRRRRRPSHAPVVGAPAGEQRAGASMPAAAARNRTPASLPGEPALVGRVERSVAARVTYRLLLAHRQPGRDVERRSTIGTMAVARNAAVAEAPLAGAAAMAARHAERCERDRRLAPEVVDALADAGLFRMLVPANAGRWRGGAGGDGRLDRRALRAATAPPRGAWRWPARAGPWRPTCPRSTRARCTAARRPLLGRRVRAEGARGGGGRLAPGDGALALRQRHRPLRLADGRLRGGGGGEVRKLPSGRPDVRLVCSPRTTWSASTPGTWPGSAARAATTWRSTIWSCPPAARPRCSRTAPRERGPALRVPDLRPAQPGDRLGGAGHRPRGDGRPAVARGHQDARRWAPARSRRGRTPRARTARAEARLRAARALVDDAVGEAWTAARPRARSRWSTARGSGWRPRTR